MDKNKKSEAVILRLKAKELLKNKPASPRSKLSECEIKKRIHELEVTQIELELQNEELIREKKETELAIKKYSELYDFAPSGHFTLTEEGEIIELNLCGAQMLGKERPRLKNSLFGFFVSNDTKPIFNHFLKKVFESKIQQTCDVNISINDSLQMNAHLTGIVAENGHECLVNVVDLTKLKQEETKRVQLLHILNSSLKEIYIFDPISLVIDYPNLGALRNLGYTSEAIRGMTPMDLKPEFTEESFRSAIAPLLCHEKERLFFNSVQRRANGSIYPVEVRLELVEFEDQQVLVALILDITERKLAAEELKKQKEEFEMIFNLVPAQIWFKDTKNNFIRVNHKACTDIGMTNDQIEGHSAEELFPSFAQNYFANDLEVFNNQQPILGIVEQINNSKGEIRWVHSDKIPVFGDDGEVNGIIAFVQDITERKQATEGLFVMNIERLFQNDEKEKRAAELIRANKELVFQNKEKEKLAAELIMAKERAEESDRLKSSFLANMSHEVRTPLNSIIGFSELLVDSDFEEEQKNEFIQLIITCGNDLLLVISDIMDISKLDTGEITLREIPVNIQEFTLSLVDQFNLHAAEKKLQLKLTLPENNEETIIFADVVRLNQIFKNLISNAIKFTSRGRIEIGYQKKDNMIEFYVKDTGIGIPEAYYDTVFERFRQVDDSKTRKYGGNGIGLSISKNLVQLMGGEIWLVSELDKGSIFYFTLPTCNKEK